MHPGWATFLASSSCSAQLRKSDADRTPTHRPSASTTGAPLIDQRDNSLAAPCNDISCGTATTSVLIRSRAVNAIRGLENVFIILLHQRNLGYSVPTSLTGQMPCHHEYSPRTQKTVLFP